MSLGGPRVVNRTASETNMTRNKEFLMNEGRLHKSHRRNPPDQALTASFPSTNKIYPTTAVTMTVAMVSLQDKLAKSLNQKSMIGDIFKVLEESTGVQRIHIWHCDHYGYLAGFWIWSSIACQHHWICLTVPSSVYKIEKSGKTDG